MTNRCQGRSALAGSTAILAAALLLVPVKFDSHHGLAGQQAAAASLGLGGHASGSLGGGLAGGLGGNLGGGLNGAVGAAAAGTNVNASTAGDASLSTSAQTAQDSVSNNLDLQQQASGIAASSDAGANQTSPGGSAGADLQINARAAAK